MILEAKRNKISRHSWGKRSRALQIQKNGKRERETFRLRG